MIDFDGRKFFLPLIFKFKLINTQEIYIKNFFFIFNEEYYCKAKKKSKNLDKKFLNHQNRLFEIFFWMKNFS